MLFLPPIAAPSHTVAPHPTPVGTMTWRMAGMMCCPLCHAQLEVMGTRTSDDGIEEGVLICESRGCGMAFPVRDGIPDMIPTPLLDNPTGWRCADLDLLHQRDLGNGHEHLAQVASQQQENTGLRDALVRFADITRGTVLEVGCGAGHLRFHFDSIEVDYVGVDPMLVPGPVEFPHARALSGFVPFKDGLFSDVVAVSALDHYRDSESFFEEALRVLEPDGQLHVVQAIHQAKAPLTFPEHRQRKARDTSATRDVPRQTARQMREFTRALLLDGASSWFTIVRERVYPGNGRSPDRLMITLAPS